MPVARLRAHRSAATWLFLWNNGPLQPTESNCPTAEWGGLPTFSSHPAPVPLTVLLITADGSPVLTAAQPHAARRPRSPLFLSHFIASVSGNAVGLPCRTWDVSQNAVLLTSPLPLSRTGHPLLPASLTGLPAAALPSWGCFPTWQKEPLPMPVSSDLLRTLKGPESLQVPTRLSIL